MSDRLTRTPAAVPHYDDPPAASGAPGARRFAIRGWLLHDSPYILMLALALVGVTFRTEGLYWMALTPVFGVTCIIAGWGRAETRPARLRLVYSQVLIWCALIFAIHLLYNQGLLAVNGSSLAMMTLLALGTFVAGVQARLWQTCAVGVLLFLAVPSIGWLNQSALLLDGIALAVIVVGGLTWWLTERRRRRNV